MCAEGHMFITHGRSVAAGQHINIIRTSGQRARVTNDCSSGGRDDISRRNSKDITLSQTLSHTQYDDLSHARICVCNLRLHKHNNLYYKLSILLGCLASP